MKNESGKQTPTGVKIISIWHYFGGILAILLGILSFIVAGMIGSESMDIPVLGVLGVGLLIVGGLILVAFGIVILFVGRGLWKGKSWARTVAIIFAGIGILFSIFAMIAGDISGNLPNVVINGVIGGYLLFNQKVKDFFA